MLRGCLAMLCSRMEKLLVFLTLWRNSIPTFLGGASITDVSSKGCARKLHLFQSIIFTCYLSLILKFKSISAYCFVDDYDDVCLG